MVMVVAAVRRFGRGGGGRGSLKIVLQAGVCFLGGRKIAGLQGAGQILVVRVRLAVLAEGLAGCLLRTALRAALGITLQRLLKAGQRRLGGGNIARGERAANGLEILNQLVHFAARVRGWVSVGVRGDTGDGAHNLSV